MRYALLVAVGGAAGSLLRWVLAGAVQRWTASALPWGTFAVNALGSLLIGIVAAIECDAMIGEGLVTLEKVDILKYAADPPKS